ncbi:hypothetical protein FQN54_008979 [Arachnomyces sp. PD_36]|nr:hypothetical protein FQN54_008979 [Arachnomyces sp. PD_36]
MPPGESPSNLFGGPRQDPSASELLSQIRHHVELADHPSRLMFYTIDTEKGSVVAKKLDEEADREGLTYGATYNSLERSLEVNMFKGAIHHLHTSWLSRQLIQMATHSEFATPEELRLLGMGNGPRRGYYPPPCFHTYPKTAFTGFSHPYTSSVRAPDQYIMQRDKEMPNIVFESRLGRADESIRRRDVNLWLKGGSGIVQLVILFVWFPRPSSIIDANIEADGLYPPLYCVIDAEIEVYGLDKDGDVALLQKETLYPYPRKPVPVDSKIPAWVLNRRTGQVIRVTRGQLFGSSLPAGRNPDDVFGFSLDDIRDTTWGPLTFEGWTVS